MADITVRKWELLSCFGVEPHLAESDVPRCFNSFLGGFHRAHKE